MPKQISSIISNIYTFLFLYIYSIFQNLGTYHKYDYCKLVQIHCSLNIFQFPDIEHRLFLLLHSLQIQLPLTLPINRLAAQRMFFFSFEIFLQKYIFMRIQTSKTYIFSRIGHVYDLFHHRVTSLSIYPLIGREPSHD